MTWEEFDTERKRLVIVRRKINEARRALDEDWSKSLFNADVGDRVTVKLNEDVPTAWYGNNEYTLKKGKSYTIEVISLTISSNRKFLRITFYVNQGKYNTVSYVCVSTKLEIV